jgi:RHS repeat-associated protein
MRPPFTVSSGGTIAVPVETGGGLFQVAVEKDPTALMEGVKVYLYTQSGSYLGLSQVTDVSGTVGFDVSEGTYKVRADYLGYQFWSSGTLVTENTSIDLTIAHQEVDITVSGMFQGTAESLEGIDVYLFTPTDSYLGEHETTDGDGQALFDLPEQAYKVRADYLGGQFWSEEFTWQDTAVELPMAEAEITVTGNDLPLEGVEVYVFSGGGSYLGVHGTSGVEGKVIFRLPAADYLFRADYQGAQFRSGVETLAADVINPITIATGGGSFTFRVLKGADDPLVGVNCYVFNEDGSYLGISGITSSEGEVSFDLADGSYQFRVDHLGYQFWSDMIEVPVVLDYTASIVHQYIAITIEGVLAGDVQPIIDIPVYLYSPSGAYLGLSESTDDLGEVIFNLPEKPFKVRADYLGQQFWSEEFTWQDTTVTIAEGIAQVHVSMAGENIEGAPVYVYSASDSYLGVSGTTDVNGIVEFRLPAATYKFRADHQGEQYWVSVGILEDTVNYVEVDAGGGEFVLTVDDGTGPLVNKNVYVYSSGGSYLGISGATDENGQVSFDLSDGSYKFRLDQLGYQFWTQIYDVPQTLSDVFTIQHQQVVITIEGLYLSAEPLVGLKVYLYTSVGAYQGTYQVTDANGQVSFSLPDEEYKVRVDYLGEQFWSDPFQWLDTTVTINQGLATVHVHRTGVDVEGVKVYLFSGSGSYLGEYETTDAYGEVEFLLSDSAFKFRVDEGGNQCWSDVINIIAWEENPVELDLDLLALRPTNDPHPVVLHGTPPAYKPEVKLASLSMIPGLIANVVVSSVPQEGIRYYHNDHLGTPQKMTNENGQVVWSADYMPFGEASVTIATTEDNFRFPGQYLDQETGLHYNYHRYYEPGTGRYLTPDPSHSIQPIGKGIFYRVPHLLKRPQELNLYPYVLNNPIMYRDFFGLQCDECPGGEWEGTTFFGIAAFWGGGGSLDRVFWSCKSGDAYCEAVYFCFGGGPIGEATIDLAGTCIATGAPAKSDLTEISSGWRGSAFGLSGTATGLKDGPKIECISGGLGVGGGVAYITCVTVSSTCN